MSGAPVLDLHWADWVGLVAHFMVLSLLSVGGALTTVSDMHRYLVFRQHWLSEPQFASSIALAQAAPGPNILFVALLGWHLGLNAGGVPWAIFGAVLAMIAILTPSSLLVYLTARWSHANRERREVKAFKQGMAPVVVALMLATGWVLARAYGEHGGAWGLWVLTGVCTILVWRTRLHILWLLAAGGVLGALGLV